MTERYLHFLLANGATVAKAINAADIVTAPWVIMKCRYGCPRYGHNRSCPPFSPGWDEMRGILACYSTAIIYGVGKMEAGTPLALKALSFIGKDGHYRALGFGTGPCTRCEVCTPACCPTPGAVLPSPEACGIDLIATVRGAGLPIEIPPQEGAEPHFYGLLLVK